MNNAPIDWAWLFPKIFFAVVIIAAGLISTISIIRNKKNKNKTNYSKIVFYLIIFWLTSDAIDILINRLKAPTQKPNESSLNQFFGSIPNIEVKKNREVCLEAIADNIDGSRVSVFLITSHYVGQNPQTERAQNFISRVNQRMVNEHKPKIVLKRLVWRPPHLDFIFSYKEEIDKIPYYEIKYLNPSKISPIPIIPCVLIDRKIVHFGLEYLGSEETDICVRDKEIARCFLDYFHSLWGDATYLKQKGSPVDIDKISEIKENWNKTGAR
jgi:hypothetical protein